MISWTPLSLAGLSFPILVVFAHAHPSRSVGSSLSSTILLMADYPDSLKTICATQTPLERVLEPVGLSPSIGHKEVTATSHSLDEKSMSSESIMPTIMHKMLPTSTITSEVSRPGTILIEVIFDSSVPFQATPVSFPAPTQSFDIGISTTNGLLIATSGPAPTAETSTSWIMTISTTNGLIIAVSVPAPIPTPTPSTDWTMTISTQNGLLIAVSTPVPDQGTTPTSTAVPTEKSVRVETVTTTVVASSTDAKDSQSQGARKTIRPILLLTAYCMGVLTLEMVF